MPQRIAAIILCFFLVCGPMGICHASDRGARKEGPPTAQAQTSQEQQGMPDSRSFSAYWGEETIQRFLNPSARQAPPPSDLNKFVFTISTRGNEGDDNGSNEKLRRAGPPLYAKFPVEVDHVRACANDKRKTTNGNFQALKTTISEGEIIRAVGPNDSDEAMFHRDIADFIRLRARSRSVSIYIHGFNNEPEDAVRRAAELTERMGFDGASLVFIWPAFGTRKLRSPASWKNYLVTARGVTHYLYDLQSSNWSRDSLAHLISTLAHDDNIDRINLIAHSMGSWLTMEALRHIAIEKGNDVLARVWSVNLIAPDIDVDVFKKQIGLVQDSYGADFLQRVTVYSNKNDGALSWSAGGHFAPRLGQITQGAEAKEDPNYVELTQEGIQIIDTEKFASDCDDSASHYKVVDNRAVQRIRTSFGMPPETDRGAMTAQR